MSFSRRFGFVSIWKEVYSRSLWVTWALTSFVVAIAGPFGTFAAQAFLWRLSYWGVVIAVAILLSIFFRTIWRNVFDGKPALPEDIFVSITLSFVFGPFVVVLNRYLVGPDIQGNMGFLAAIGFVLAIAASTIAIRRFLREPAPIQSVPASRDRLLQRFPVENGARLARISSDNHHIRITTNDGAEHRLLMRLRDAVAEVDIEPGICVHRSHWIARASIAGVELEDGREAVKLSDGSMVPIGPKYRSNLIDVGVISD